MAASGTSQRPFPLPGAAILLRPASIAWLQIRDEAGFLILAVVALFVAVFVAPAA